VWDTWSETKRYGEPDPFEHQLGPAFLDLVRGEFGRGARTVIDVGTGRGRVALEVAPRAREIVGLDVDPQAVEEARAAARRHAVTNVRFEVADCERVDLLEAARLDTVDLVTMHLCVSEPMIHRAAHALRAGGAVAGVMHEASRWKETGMPSHYAATREQLEEALAAAHLRLERGRLETSVMRFLDAAECERYLREGPSWNAWQHNGRWASWRDRIERRPGHPIELTRSHLVFLARKID